MFQLIAVLALSFAMIVSGSAQTEAASTRCLRFAVVEAELPSGASGTWPADARNWWEEDGKRKFRELCEVTRQDADFLLVWKRERTVETVRRPAPGWMDSMLSDIPRLGWDCSMDHMRQERCVRRLVLPAMEPLQWENRVETRERVSVTVNRVQAGSLLPAKSITKKGGKAGKKSIDSALKFLRKEARKPRAAKGPAITALLRYSQQQMTQLPWIEHRRPKARPDFDDDYPNSSQLLPQDRVTIDSPTVVCGSTEVATRKQNGEP